MNQKSEARQVASKPGICGASKVLGIDHPNSARTLYARISYAYARYADAFLFDTISVVDSVSDLSGPFRLSFPKRK